MASFINNSNRDQVNNVLSRVLYVRPLKAFLYASGDPPRWQFTQTFDPYAIEVKIIKELHRQDIDEDFVPRIAKQIMKEKVFGSVEDLCIAMTDQQIIHKTNGEDHLNYYTPPEIKPNPGPYPRIDAILGHLCGQDAAAVHYVKHWVARKIQNPELAPRNALVFAGGQGFGKGTFFRVLQEIIGMENFAAIGREKIENQYNLSWATKFMVFAEEMTSGKQGQRSITNKLKHIMSDTHINVEDKYVKQLTIRNRMAWIFSSNDKHTPVEVENTDRRFSIFESHGEPNQEHKDRLLSCFEGKDNSLMTPDFYAEVQGFFDYCLKLEVDTTLVQKPFDNGSRTKLKRVSSGTPELFIEALEKHGVVVMALIARDYLQKGSVALSREYDDWAKDRKKDEARSLSTALLYLLYRGFCHSEGHKNPYSKTSFLQVVQNHRPDWQPDGNDLITPTNLAALCKDPEKKQ